VELEKRGVPTATCITEPFLALAAAERLALGLGDLRIVPLPHPLGFLPAESLAPVAERALRPVVAALTAATSDGEGEAGAPRKAGPPGSAARGGIDAPWPWDRAPANLEGLESFNRWMISQRLGDGLLLLPPSGERVESLLRSSPLDRGALLGSVPPRHGLATVETAAAAAAMAGVPPEAFPIVVAAIQAMCDPAFDLYGIQATTNPAAPLVLVNGPVRIRAGLNCGAGALGPGAESRVNLAVGRAIRLALLNLGGASVGDVDKATHGQPAKVGLCIGEAEETSPWRPFHTERGFAAHASAVTVVAVSGTANVADVASRSAESLARMLAHSMDSVGSNDMHFGGQPMLLLGPEHAAILGAEGWSRRRLQEHILEHAARPARFFSCENVKAITARRPGRLGKRDGEILIAPADRAEDILVAVAGSSGAHSVHLPTFGNTRAVSRPVEVTDG
jgi:hypothetical protein